MGGRRGDVSTGTCQVEGRAGAVPRRSLRCVRGGPWDREPVSSPRRFKRSIPRPGTV